MENPKGNRRQNKRKGPMINHRTIPINLDTILKEKVSNKLKGNVKQSTRLSVLLKMSVSREVQLKHSWNPEDCSTNVSVEEDQITARRAFARDSTDCIRGKIGFTEGLHLWEIIWPIEQRGTHACIGVATSEAILQCTGYQSLIGLDNQSWGLNPCNGMKFHNCFCTPYPEFLKDYESTQIKFHKIQVILNMDKGSLGFIADGQYLGEAFNNLKGRKLYPFISSVFGNSQITMKYQGYLNPNPLSLQELCRHTIRDRLIVNSSIEELKSLGLPKPIEKYLSYKE